MKDLKREIKVKENKSKRKYVQIIQKPENNINNIIKDNLFFIQKYLNKMVSSNECNIVNKGANTTDSNNFLSEINHDFYFAKEQEQKQEEDICKNIKLIFGIFNAEETETKDENIKAIFNTNSNSINSN